MEEPEKNTEQAKEEATAALLPCDNARGTLLNTSLSHSARVTLLDACLDRSDSLLIDELWKQSLRCVDLLLISLL